MSDELIKTYIYAKKRPDLKPTNKYLQKNDKGQSKIITYFLKEAAPFYQKPRLFLFIERLIHAHMVFNHQYIR